jgi:hypothetical protein
MFAMRFSLESGRACLRREECNELKLSKLMILIIFLSHLKSNDIAKRLPIPI